MANQEERKSYGQILKSSGIVGGAQVIGILLTVIRTKIVALLIGPIGYGIMSGLQAALDVIRQATSCGIQLSAPRELSQSQNTSQINRTLIILRRWALYTGLLGVLATVVLCYPLSQYAFDNNNYAISIACLSVTLLLLSMSNINTAILQGLRQLRKMAAVSLWGAVWSTIAIVPIYYFWGIQGIAPSIIVSALILWFISWLYTRKIKVNKEDISFRQTIKEGLSSAKLGLYLVLSGFILTVVMYSVRAFLVRKIDIEAVGWFQAAWNVSNMYIWTILSAMGADFIPRLTAICSDRKESGKLINQQLEMALLVMTPILLLLIGGATWVIRILYSSEFVQAISILQWQLAGGIFTVFSWCLGVLFVADNKGYYSLWSEVVWGVFYFLFLVICWPVYDFLSLGIAYVIAGLIRAIVVFVVVRKISKFSLSPNALRDFLVMVVAALGMLANISLTNGMVQYSVSFLIFVLVAFYAYKRLSSVIGLKELVRKIIKRN